MKDKIIYWLKIIRNSVEAAMLLMLANAFFRTLCKIKYYHQSHGFMRFGDWDNWFLNTAIRLKRLYPEMFTSEYIWQYYFEIALLILPFLFFISLELYKRRLFIFKNVDVTKEERIKKKINKLNTKLK